MEQQVKYIGVVHSKLKKLEDCPLQENENAPEALIEIFAEFSKGASNINTGDEVLLFTWLDKADRSILETKPRNNPNAALKGVFSTRSPGRPNPIGIHVVKIISKQSANEFLVAGLEVLDQTALLDIKPQL